MFEILAGKSPPGDGVETCSHTGVFSQSLSAVMDIKLLCAIPHTCPRAKRDRQDEIDGEEKRPTRMGGATCMGNWLELEVARKQDVVKGRGGSRLWEESEVEWTAAGWGSD